MSPLRNTRLIPSGWAEHHASVAAGGFSARVRVLDVHGAEDIELGELDPVTGTYPAETPSYLVGGPYDENPDWRGGVPVRIQQLATDRSVESAGEVISLRNYLAQAPWDLPPVEVGAEVLVAECEGDPQLVGVRMRLSGVALGPHRFTRDLYLEHAGGGAHHGG